MASLLLILNGYLSSFGQDQVNLSKSIEKDDDGRIVYAHAKPTWAKSYDEVFYSDGLFICKNYINTPVLKGVDTIYYEKHTEACVYTSRGKLITKDEYNDIGDFKEGLARVMKSKKRWADLNCFIGLKGFIDKKGKLVIPVMYSYVADFSEGLAAVYDTVGRQYYIDQQNNKHFYNRFRAIDDFYNGVAAVKLHNQKRNYIDHTGKLLIPERFDFIESREKLNYRIEKDTLLIVSKNKKYGLLGEKGRLVVPLTYDLIDTTRAKRFQGYSPVIDQGKKGFINTYNGEIIIAPAYEDFKKASHSDFVWAKKGEKWGAITRSNDPVIPFIYSGIRESFSDYAIVEKEKAGIIGNDGRTIIPCVYDNLSPFYEDIALAIQDGKVGYVTKKGQVLIQPQYDKGSYFMNGEAIVEKRLFRYTINQRNEQLKTEFNKKGIILVTSVLGFLLVVSLGVFFKRRNNQMLVQA